MELPLPKFILLPGLDGTGDLFKFLLDELPLGANSCVIRYPRAATAYVDLAPVVRSAIPATEPYILIAESFSTPLAITLAADCPGNLRGVVLCAGFAASPVQGIARRLAGWLSAWLPRIPLSGFTAQILLVGRNGPKALVECVLLAVNSVPAPVLAARMRAVLECDARDDLQRVAAPMLYLQAANDHVVRQSCLEEISQLRPDVLVVQIDGPHLLLQRKPKQCAEVIVEFARQLGSQAQG